MMRPLPLAACLALAAALPVAAVTTQQEAAAPSPAMPAAQVAAPAPATLVGDPQRGRSLAYTCQGCHGITGYRNVYPSFKVPMIGGQSAEYLTQALLAYRAGQRKHPTMQAQSESFSEQDIADLAAYLSSLK
jgi:cytochrome c553